MTDPQAKITPPARTSPYQGLTPFTPDDTEYFFGREQDTEIITANLVAERLTLLYGPSGVGKSSVLGAGVVHNLRERAQREIARGDTPEYLVVYFNDWRNEPVSALLKEIEKTLQPFAPTTPTANTLADALRGWSDATDAELLFILDQFEEFFLYHQNDQSDTSFAAQFANVLKDANGRANFMLSFREDALAKLDFFKKRIPNLFKNYLRIKHLDADAARRAIEKPLEKYNALHPGTPPITIESTLVDAILQDVQVGNVVLGETGRGTLTQDTHVTAVETPFLQLVLTRLWTYEREQNSNTLRLASFNDLGGAEKIVRGHLEKAINALSEPQRVIAANIFDHLVTPSGTKIAQTAHDLAEYAKVSDQEMNEVLEKLARGDNRILRPVAPSLENLSAPRYEIFHDVLSNAILDWRAQYEKNLEQEKQRKDLEAKRRADAQKAELQRARILKFATIGLSGLLVVAIIAVVAALFFLIQSNMSATEANSQRQIAEANATEANSQKQIAEVNATEANNQKQTAEAAALNQAAAANTAQAASIVSDSRRLASISNINRINNFDLSLLLGVEALKIADNVETKNNLLVALDTQLITTLRGDNQPVTTIAFSPDARTIAFGGADKTIQLWDAATGKQIESPWNAESPVESVAFSPDGKILVSGSDDATIRLWDVGTGKLLASFGGGGSGILSVVVSPDGRTLSSGSNDGTIRLWDVATGQSIGELKGHKDAITSVAFSPDGKTLASGSADNTIVLWDVTTDTKVGELTGHASAVTSVAISPDGKSLVSSSFDKTIRLWNLNTQQAIGELSGQTDNVLSVSFSSDGKTIASGGQSKVIFLWDVATQQQVAQLNGHTDAIRAIDFSPDGKTLASASNDGTARIWSITGGRGRQVLQGFVDKEIIAHKDQVLDVQFSADGKHIVSASADKTAIVWDSANKTDPIVLRGHTDSVLKARFSPDGAKIATASADHTARIWDSTSSKAMVILQGHTDSVLDVNFSSDGKKIITASADNTAKIWATGNSKEIATLRGHTGQVSTAEFSPDNSKIVTASVDRTARIWDAITGNALVTLKGHTGSVSAAHFSPDGDKIVTASTDGTARVWDAISGKELLVLSGHSASVVDAIYSPDANLIVTMSADKTLKEWDADTGELRATLVGHTDRLTSASFAMNEKVLASGSFDQTIRLWDVETGKPLGVPLLGHTGPVSQVQFSEDGKSLVSGSYDTTVRLWDTDFDPKRLQARACAIVNRNLTRAEYAEYLDSYSAAYDGVYGKNPTCPDLPVERESTPTPEPTATGEGPGILTATPPLHTVVPPTLITNRIRISAGTYSPKSITIRVGTTVTWVNTEAIGSEVYSVTSGVKGQANGLFDSGLIPSGQTFQFTFTIPGNYRYYSTTNPTAMTGEIIVVP